MPLAFVACVGPENMTENIFDSCRRHRRLFYRVLATVLSSAIAQAGPPAMTTVTEALFGKKSGEEKKEAALSFTSAALGLPEAVLNRDVIDERKFNEGLSKIIDGVVQCLNASSWLKMQ